MRARKISMFLSLVNKIYKEARDETSLIRFSTELFQLLLRCGVPVYFDINNVILDSDKIYNDNFSFTKFLDYSGEEKLLMPYNQIEAREIQQIFDLDTETFVTPKKRAGKISLQKIYSFRKIGEIADALIEQIEIVKQLSEDEIEEKISLEIIFIPKPKQMT
jgi:hypothetical protein